jgi:hypothetical protein
MSHTPGPWRFSSDGHIVSASTGERVCTPHSTLLGGKVSDQIKDLKRNARLIAAAPEMLEALRLIAETEWVDVALDPQRAVRLARAVIAKAMGETK